MSTCASFVPIVTAPTSVLPLHCAHPGCNLPVHVVKFRSTFTVTASGLSVPKVNVNVHVNELRLGF